MRARWVLVIVVGSVLVIAAARWTATSTEHAGDAGSSETKAVSVSGDVARSMLRDVKRWDAASAGERRGVAERVTSMLDGFTLLRVQPFGFEGHRHEIAVFLQTQSGLEFSLIPGGTSRMGSPEGEVGRASGETPHQVTLTRAFLLARTECTQAAYDRVMEQNPSAFHATDGPVENVLWDEVTEFCAKARLRLPTEAEWEFACRAGTTTVYWSGGAESDLARVGWYAENIDPMPNWGRSALDKVGGQSFQRGTQRVAALPANPFGLHDVHGNVWEWCADWYGDYPTTAVSDPVGPAAAEYRVVRGGGWCGDTGGLRCAGRGMGDPSVRYDFIGFRPAKSVPDE